MSGSEPERFETAGPDETEAIGARAAADLRAGDVILVSGEMGAGKTTFVRGACRRLGVSGPITSPTFTIGRRYEGAATPVSHLDLHRLADLAREDPALLADYVDARHIAFVEWPEVAAPALAPAVALRVVLRHLGGDRRSVELSRVR